MTGRVIWCDEASLLDNADMTWLLNFARDNASRLVVSGDPRQHGAVQRGHPFKMPPSEILIHSLGNPFLSGSHRVRL